jgi:NTE family protein
MPTAIVLGGGGARGDFEVGAIRYLYEIGWRPDIICGSSVGSINGVKLAEGKGLDQNGADKAMEALRGLEQIWLDMKQNEHMWKEESWLTSLTNSKVIEFFKKPLQGHFGAVALEAGKFYLFPSWLVYDPFRKRRDG